MPSASMLCSHSRGVTNRRDIAAAAGAAGGAKRGEGERKAGREVRGGEGRGGGGAWGCLGGGCGGVLGALFHTADSASVGRAVACGRRGSKHFFRLPARLPPARTERNKPNRARAKA